MNKLEKKNMMTKLNMIQMIDYIHSMILLYILFGWIFESQRKLLVVFLPTIQFQFLINNNNCLLTQLENKLLKDEKKDIELNESFTDKKLKEYNIHLSSKSREYMIHSITYISFLLNYYMMVNVS